MDLLELIHQELSKIAIQLDQIPQKIQQVPELEYRENILLIGKALSHVFELQHNIQKLRPELKNLN